MNENPKQFIIDNFAYRLGERHPTANIQVGCGNPNASIVIVQPHRKFPERDAVTGALKRFGMLDQAFRTTSVLVDFDMPDVPYPDVLRANARGEKPRTQSELNKDYLIELIEIIRPMLVIVCGPDVLSCLSGREIQRFSQYTGKRIKLDNLSSMHVCVTLNPMDYGFARASDDLKQQGKNEWEAISDFYHQERKRREDLRWAS